MKRIAFCVSGRGRVVEAILDAKRAGLLTLNGARIVLDRESEFAAVADQHGVPCDLIDCKSFADKELFRAALAGHLTGLPVDALFLTFAWVLPPHVVRRFYGSIVNLHMSLLPLFAGTMGSGPVDAALESGMKVAGVTIHTVNDGVDTGPIIAQAVTHTGTANLGLALFRRAVPLSIQVTRWLETGSETRAYDDGPFFPRLDDDISEFALDYLDRRYPAT